MKFITINIIKDIEVSTEIYFVCIAQIILLFKLFFVWIIFTLTKIELHIFFILVIYKLCLKLTAFFRRIQNRTLMSNRNTE